MDFSNPNWLEDYNKKLDEMLSASDALGEGVVKGKIFSVPVADGCAYYKVVRVNKKSAKVEWVEELALDGYTDFMIGMGGTLPMDKIASTLAYQENIRRITRER